jgi:dTDP-4-dehydrorhamnose reductase
MHILLLGHKGYLGSYLLEHFSVDTIKNAGSNYDYIINCIGKPNVEWCEEHPYESLVSNYTVVCNIIKTFPKSKIIHFSSYYVYDGPGSCTEESSTTDKYCYMKHKLQSEKVVVDAGGVCFRLGKLFGTFNFDRFSTKLPEHIILNDKLVLDMVQFNPTGLEQVLDVIRFELKTNCLKGLYNLCNKGHTTHFEFGRCINDFLDGNKQITAVDRIDKMFHNYGRFVMDSSKIEQCITLKPWREELELYLLGVKQKCLV